MNHGSMHVERVSHLAMTHGSMHMGRYFCLAMTYGSMHALEVRISDIV